MNRKQKVLTIIALIAFVVIGACHYLPWPLVEFHEIRLATREQRVAKARKIWNHMDDRIQSDIKAGADFDVENNDLQFICDVQEVRQFVRKPAECPSI